MADSEAAVHRLLAVDVDESSIGRGNPDQEHERRIAVADLLDNNRFAIPGHAGGPYRLSLALHDGRLMLDIRTADRRPVVVHTLSLTPFRSLMKDYFLVCESYYAAIRTATPDQIEAIDMGRRGLHDAAADLLTARLHGKITADFATMRRLFTLIAALHWKG